MLNGGGPHVTNRYINREITTYGEISRSLIPRSSDIRGGMWSNHKYCYPSF